MGISFALRMDRWAQWTLDIGQWTERGTFVYCFRNYN